MNVGTIGYATSRGLGHLVKDFHTRGIINDVFVVRHRGVPTNEDWYPGAPVADIRDVGKADVRIAMENFCQQHDAMLFFETPFDWNLLPFCRQHGVRTYLVTMYECTPTRHHEPHRYICPSALDMEFFPSGVFLHLPTEYPWRLRTRAEHFIHNGGYLGLRGGDGHNREGTTTLIEAMKFVKSPIRLTIRCQENVPTAWLEMARNDPRIEYVPETVPYLDLYASGDVAIGAQKWNGCSLPLQEARASGMLVMNTDRFPANTWLPKEPLIPVDHYTKHRIGGGYLEFQEARVTPQTIAETIDAWYGRDIEGFSLSGKAWAAAGSWDVLKPQWLEVLAS